MCTRYFLQVSGKVRLSIYGSLRHISNAVSHFKIEIFFILMRYFSRARWSWHVGTGDRHALQSKHVGRARIYGSRPFGHFYGVLTLPRPRILWKLLVRRNFTAPTDFCVDWSEHVSCLSWVFRGLYYIWLYATVRSIIDYMLVDRFACREYV